MVKGVRIVICSIPSGGNFIFADFETPRCQFCTKMPEMSDLCYLGKTRMYCLLFMSPILTDIKWLHENFDINKIRLGNISKFSRNNRIKCQIRVKLDKSEPLIELTVDRK